MERSKGRNYKDLAAREIHAKSRDFVGVPRDFSATFSHPFKQGRGGSKLSNCYNPVKLSFSIREACTASSLGRTTIYSHIASGRLKAVRIGRRTVIPAASLEALVNGIGHDC